MPTAAPNVARSPRVTRGIDPPSRVVRSFFNWTLDASSAIKISKASPSRMARRTESVPGATAPALLARPKSRRALLFRVSIVFGVIFLGVGHSRRLRLGREHLALDHRQLVDELQQTLRIVLAETLDPKEITAFQVDNL